MPMIPNIPSPTPWTTIFLGVYGDEFRAMAMTCAIGRGVSRNRLIISKLIDNIILSVILFGIFAIEAVIAGLIMGAGMTSEETFALVLYIMIGAVKSVGYTSIASIILFVNANIPIGVFVLLVLHMIMPIVINTASSSSKLLSSLHLDRWFFGGMVESGYSSIVLGMTAGGIMTLVLGCVIYIGISVGVTIALFSKREMDF